MKIFIVQNKQGKYLRSKGFDGKNPIKSTNWVDKIEDAKIYTKIGTAKGRVTFFFHNYPKFGCANILEFDLTKMQPTVIDLEKETTKKVAKIKQKEAEREAQRKQYRIDRERELVAHLREKGYKIL